MKYNLLLTTIVCGLFYYGNVHAQCVATQDCAALGYTESSCSGGGVKCPFGNYWFCGEKKGVCQSCKAGMILNSDMTCSRTKTSGKTPIGVVVLQVIAEGADAKCAGLAVALNDIGFMNFSKAGSQSNSYSAGGVTGWRLPTHEELLMMHTLYSDVESGLTNAGGTTFQRDYYWSSTFYAGSPDGNFYTTIYISPGGYTYRCEKDNSYVRPVLAF